MLAVTGMTGHTGGFFLRELIEGQYAGKIRCLVRSSDKASGIATGKLDIEFVEGNLDNDESIRKFLSGADTVVHIANIHFSKKIIDLGRECGVKRFILVHTTGIYSQFKYASQEYIRIENDIAPLMTECCVTILRPTMIFGDLCDHNISKFIRFVDRLAVLPVVGDGESLIQPVNARDLGRALYQVLLEEKTAGKAYDLSGEKALSIRQLYGMIAENLGKKRVILGIPMGLCVFCARTVRFFSFGKIDLVEKVQRMGECRAYSHEAAAKDFGYAPESFEIGLRREVDAYRVSIRG